MATTESILVVEDTHQLREVLCTVLEREGFSVASSESAEDAIEKLSAGRYSCVLADFKLPGMTGIELLGRVREILPQQPFVIMTAYGSVEIAVEAMKKGANDFISKPFEPSQLAPMLRQVIQHRRIFDRGPSRSAGVALSSSSARFEKLLSQARQVAKVDSAVLLLGESGTGKELLARYIHDHSPRCDKPFLALNCAAIPEELLESEFFGHEAGSFTGATQSRIGILEAASEGTVFLDEVGDMPALLQVKLLRALQEREIRRVGSSKHIRVNPRIISATNRSIEDAISGGSMREDFYYRIAVISFSLPPLRERREDIRALSQHFFRHFSERSGRSGLSVEPVVFDLLEAYPWPGNIRELENVIERAVIMSDNSVKPEHLGIHIPLNFSAIHEATRTLPEIAAEAMKFAEVEAINRALMHTGGNKSKAAIILGVSYKTLLNKIRDYEIQSNSQDEEGIHD